MHERRLSSDILERQFGKTYLKVLSDDNEPRIICTRALDGDRVLEISSVTFTPAGAEKFPDAHRAVLAGESMGKVFREHGIPFRRNIQALYGYTLPANFERWFGESGQATIIDLTVVAGPDDTPYARILETFSPAVHWPNFTPGSMPEHTERIEQLDRFLSGRSPE
ncbi:MAG TPA: hypothetical protein VIJ68_03675 [Candidatus Saccharimonadales bacterium]